MKKKSTGKKSSVKKATTKKKIPAKKKVVATKRRITKKTPAVKKEINRTTKARDILVEQQNGSSSLAWIEDFLKTPIEPIESEPEVIITEPKQQKEYKLEINIDKAPPLSPYVVRLELGDNNQKENFAFTPNALPALQTIEVPEESDEFDLEQIMESETETIVANKSVAQAPIKTRKPFPWKTIGNAIALPFQITKKSFIGVVSWRPEFEVPNFGVPKLAMVKVLRPVAAFMILAVIFTAPASGLAAYTKLNLTKDNLLSRATGTISLLKNTNVQNQGELSEALSIAHTEFLKTQKNLQDAVGILDNVIPLMPKAGKTYESGKLLLDAGTHITEAARITSAGVSQLSESPTTPLTTRLLHFEEALLSAAPLIYAANLELGQVDSEALPKEMRATAENIKTVIDDTAASFAQTLEFLPAMEKFLGIERTQRYLVVFQNSNELRPTGGFIGSFAILDVDRGEIKSMEIPGGGPYDLACCVSKHVISPEPLHLIEPHWQFKDANWFADFPTSAQKLAWFYEISGGSNVDGVIAINSDILPKLLEVLGPIEMPKYGRTFTAENFIAETQKIVELEYDKEENKPKAVIGEMAPIIIARLMSAQPEQFLSLLGILGESIRTKDIQIYSNDPAVESALSTAGMTGELKKTNGDFLSVNIANIAGGKTDGVIDTKISHRAKIMDDGSIIDRVEITRTHNGTKNDLFSGVRNVSYVKVIVPEGSTLIETRGFEAPPTELFKEPATDYVPDLDLATIQKKSLRDETTGTQIIDELGYTTFGNWMQVDPGAKTTVNLTYKLPWKLNDINDVQSKLARFLGLPQQSAYTLFVQKQSGLKAMFETEITPPQNARIAWYSGAGSKISDSSFISNSLLETDMFISLLLQL